MVIDAAYERWLNEQRAYNEMPEYVILNCECCKKPVVKLHKELLSRIRQALQYGEGQSPHFYHPDCPSGYEKPSV